MTVNEDFMPKGKKIYYWPNGNKRMEGQWESGKKNGEFIFYDQNGKVTQRLTYLNDILDGSVKKILNEKTVIDYSYEAGTLNGSKEYIGNTLIGVYGYSDALIYPDPDSPEPPPVGTIYHAYNGKSPAEIYKGTLWTYIENSFEIDDNGNKVPVDVWLREGNGGHGPYIYNGEFIEYRTTDGTMLRKGKYSRKITSNAASSAVLHGEEYLYRSNGSPIYHAKWNMGDKVDKVEYYDNKSRIWKSVNLKTPTTYSNGIYNIWDIGLDGNINYVFNPDTQVASLKLFK